MYAKITESQDCSLYGILVIGIGLFHKLKHSMNLKKADFLFPMRRQKVIFFFDNLNT